MKVALVYPRYGQRPPSYPLGLGYVAAALVKAGHEVVPILQDVERELTADDIARRVAEMHVDVIGTGALVSRYHFVKELGDAVKRHCPKTPFIVGGKIADSIPERLLEKARVDVVCFGEGEELVVELMEALGGRRTLASVRGIAFMSDGEIVRTLPRDPISDLDMLPFPAYDLFPMKTYLEVPLDDWLKRLIPGAKKPVAMQTNRGCPFTCTFCKRSFEPKKIRKRSIGNVVSELRTLKERYGFDSVIFNDELTLVGKQRALELAEGMRAASLGMIWHCLARVDVIDREMLRSLRAAGCTSIGFGIESGSQKILDEMNKRVTVEMARDALRLCEEEGMIVNCTYIVGMPSESPETIAETVEFIKTTRAYGPLFFATAYPGTAFWDHAVASGTIPDIEEYLDRLNNVSDYVSNFTAMSEEELLEAHRRASLELARSAILNQLRTDPSGFVVWLYQKLQRSLSVRGLAGTFALAGMVAKTALLRGKPRRLKR